LKLLETIPKQIPNKYVFSQQFFPHIKKSMPNFFEMWKLKY